MKAFYNQHGNVYAEFPQNHDPNLYLEALWLNSGDGMRLSVYWDSHRNGCGYERIGRPKELSPRYISYGKKAYRSIRHTSQTLRWTVLRSSTHIWVLGKRTNCRRSRSS